MVEAPFVSGEQVYSAAADASMRRKVGDNVVAGLTPDELRRYIAYVWDTPELRAAVDVGYAAGLRDGYREGRSDELNGELEPEWYRLATAKTCQPGQPHDCGDMHESGHCVRKEAATDGI